MVDFQGHFRSNAPYLENAPKTRHIFSYNSVVTEYKLRDLAFWLSSHCPILDISLLIPMKKIPSII